MRQGPSLPAHLDAGSTTRGAVAGVTGGDHLHPERIRALVVRRGAGPAQRIQAVLRRTRGCSGESQHLKNHPRAAIQFRQGEGHGRPFGCHLDLGSGSYVGAPGYGELLAIAAEYDWRLRRSSRSAESTSTCARTGSRARAGGARAGSSGSCDAGTSGSASTGSCASGSTCTTSAAETAAAAKSQAPDIALAHGSVPGGLDLTGFCVDCDAVVDAVVDENVGIGTTAERAVLVAERRGLIRRTASIIAGPRAVVLHRREIYRLGVDEFQALEGVIGADPEAAEHQVRDRSRLASGVVLVIPEGGIHHVMTVIVVLVAADREIRQCGLRQAAAVSLFRQIGRASCRERV